MKVLQVNTVCGTGSVGRICMDLYELCEEQGIEAYMAYGRGPVRKDIKAYKTGNYIDMLGHVFWNFVRGKSGFCSAKTTKAFLNYLDECKPDVIHLHNIHGFYLQVELFFEYIKKNDIKVIWTLHDCWPFTGHCAYFDFVSCEKWKTGCNNCVIHGSAYPYAVFCDSTETAYPRKKKAFGGVKDLTIVTPSKWLSDLVKESFLKEYPTKVIYNGIDLDKFQKTSGKNPVEDRLPYILGVANVWEHRKGLTCFERLAKELETQKKEKGSIPYRIVLIGLSKKQIKKLYKKYDRDVLICKERTKSTKELAVWYSNAAVYVNATLEDNFPTTNLEALACGTPVITYRTGGSGEALDESCGVVIMKGDYAKLKEAIGNVVKNSPFDEAACRKRAEMYDKKTRFMEYIKLYKES